MIASPDAVVVFELLEMISCRAVHQHRRTRLWVWRRTMFLLAVCQLGGNFTALATEICTSRQSDGGRLRLSGVERGYQFTHFQHIRP